VLAARYALMVVLNLIAQALGQSVGSPGVGVVGYPNVTLRSETLAVTVFLPPLETDDVAYYNSTRFEWSSMIGDVRVGGHKVFSSDFWRSPSDPNWQQPHDPTSPEAAVGLASEFGCGSDGASCGPGWGPNTSCASNGVLGYEDAGDGEPFLKIGVGKLLKGSCSHCRDGTYRFNSRYEFAERPAWSLSSIGPSANALDMVHEASLNTRWGYRLKKHVSVQGNALVTETELTNTGGQAFATPQYSHNFLSMDDQPIGPPLQLTLDQNVSDYTEPGVVGKYAWAKPMAEYFEPIGANTLEARTPESPLSAAPPRLKANFVASSSLDSAASYVASFSGVTVSSLMTPSKAPLYAYNLYVEETSLCPEPIQMLRLGPGETAAWSQHLFFGEFEPVDGGVDRGCRAAGVNDNSPSFYTLHTGVKSLNDCKARCLARSDCAGVEHNGKFGTGRCELWTRAAGIHATKSMPGFTCLRRVVASVGQQVILP